MSYQVKPGEGEITVHSGASQKVQFTVNNTSERPILTQTEVRVGGAVEAAWCTVDPAADTNLEAKGSRTYTVTVTPKGVARPTSGHVQLAAASVDDPSHATPSPEVRVTILPSESAPTWWQRHGKHVLIGAAVLLVAAVAGILIRPRGVAIAEFKATPTTGAPAGEPVMLSWKIKGKPQGVLLAVGDGAGTPLEEQLWEEGPFEFTSLTPGPLSVRLTAIEGGGGEDDAPLEISRKLDLTIAESTRTFTAPAITSFTVTPSSVPAGQPVRFAWTTTGDVLMLSLDFGNSAPPTVTDPVRIAAGDLELPLLPGSYRAVATAIGKDNSRVESAGVAFVVTEQTSQQAPQVKLSASATGLSPTGIRAGRPAPNLAVSWQVVGEHTGLQLSFLTHGATPSVHTLAAANGQQTFEKVFVPQGSVVQLFVGQRTGPRLVYECQVGRPTSKEGPVKYEGLELQLEHRGKIDEDERVIRTFKPGDLRRGAGG